jgi:hypothetical protein
MKNQTVVVLMLAALAMSAADRFTKVSALQLKKLETNGFCMRRSQR